jgi:hypothetical protein
MRRLMLLCWLALFTFAEIIGLQRRIREVGRLRLGVQGATAEGKRYPKKINRFRLTSPDQQIIDYAAERYGGQAQAWDNGGVEQFEVITDATAMPILLPPNPSDLGFSQFYECWAKGFCTKRCDGVRDSVRDCLCDCDPDDRECKATTRLSVILPEIAGLGVWRLESHGYYAAVELAGAVAMIEALVGVRSMVPARLRLDQREIRRLIDGKAEVRKIVVPAIDLDTSVAQVQALAAGVVPATAIGNGPAESSREISGRGGWKPVAALDEGALPVAPTIEQQLAEHDNAPPKPKRSNARAPLPATGRKPRSAAQRHAGGVEAETCSLCGEPYGGLPVVQNRDKWDRDGKVSRFVHRRCQEAERVAALDGEPDPAASQEQEEDGGRGGMDSGPGSSPGDAPPAPAAEPPSAAEAMATPPPLATAGPRMPTAKMHKAIFADMAEVFPIPPGTPDAAEARHRTEGALCAAIGTPGITSHKQITFATAQLMIDALRGLKDGTLTWDGDMTEGTGQLLRAETGEPVDFTEETVP